MAYKSMLRNTEYNTKNKKKIKLQTKLQQTKFDNRKKMVDLFITEIKNEVYSCQLNNW